jgi:hypothetical protein
MKRRVDPEFKLFLKNMGRLCVEDSEYYGVVTLTLVDKTKNIFQIFTSIHVIGPANGTGRCHHLHMLLLQILDHLNQGMVH